MTCRESFDKWAAGKAFDLPWMPADTELWDTWQAAWEAKTEADKQVVMFAEPDSRTVDELRGVAIADAHKPRGVTAEDIYAAYPRKVGKQAAIKAIQKAIRQIYDTRGHDDLIGGIPAIEVLMERTKLYASHVAQWPAADKQFIPHPATWFNRGSYDDDPKEWLRGAAAQPSQWTKSYK